SLRTGSFVCWYLKSRQKSHPAALAEISGHDAVEPFLEVRNLRRGPVFRQAQEGIRRATLPVIFQLGERAPNGGVYRDNYLLYMGIAVELMAPRIAHQVEQLVRGVIRRRNAFQNFLVGRIGRDRATSIIIHERLNRRAVDNFQRIEIALAVRP